MDLKEKQDRIKKVVLKNIRDHVTRNQLPWVGFIALDVTNAVIAEFDKIGFEEFEQKANETRWQTQLRTENED